MSVGDGIGKRIRQARHVKGFSKSRLAREVGVTPTAVWNWEENEIAPRFDTLAKVAFCLEVSEAFLRTGQTEADAAMNSGSRTPSISQLVEETRGKIAEATGFPLDRVKLHLELVAD